MNTHVGIFAVLVGSMGFLIGRPYISDYFSRIEFNSDTWKQAATNSEGIRVRMIDDLLSRFQLVGKRRSEVDDLLGVPRKTEYFDNYDYVYWLGPHRGLVPIDSEWLCIKFANDRVIAADVLTD